MHIFFDRQEAAYLLFEKLAVFSQHPHAIVLGLAHGGAILAASLGKKLKIPYNVLTPRKLGAPKNPELALGAVSQDGYYWLNTSLVHSLGISDAWIQQTLALETKKAQDLAILYSQIKPVGSLKNKTVIVVDDGIATGATLQATIRSLRHQGIQKLIVAAPVAAKDVWEQIAALTDQAICLHIAQEFFGVSSFYKHFEPVDDACVIGLLKSS